MSALDSLLVRLSRFSFCFNEINLTRIVLSIYLHLNVCNFPFSRYFQEVSCQNLGQVRVSRERHFDFMKFRKD